MISWLPYLACGTLGSCIGQILVKRYYERKVHPSVIEYGNDRTPLLDKFREEEHDYYRA